MKKVVTYQLNSEITSYTGIIATAANNGVLQLRTYDNVTILLPLANYLQVDVIDLTDEEIINGEDEDFAAWFLEKKEAFEREQEVAAAADAAS